MKLKIGNTNINEQIEFIYAFFKPEAEAKGLNLSFKNTLSGKKAIIETDTEKLYAVLANLVKNSIKFTSKGQIEIGYNLTSSVSFPKMLTFYVKDTGSGIPKDQQKSIFERFVQADIENSMANDGTGLGLSISRAYIELLGGSIWVESQENIGSTFFFTLPYHAKTIKEIHKPENLQNKPIESEISGLKILIAEDDEHSEMLISNILDEAKNDIIKVRNGIEAIEKSQNIPNLDLILMDIRMPGLDGYEATRRIRAFNKEVIIIAQTAFGLSGDREKAIEAGCNDYISKPINSKQLITLIKRHLQQTESNS
jgi:CheY-like chemotaxis protein